MSITTRFLVFQAMVIIPFLLGMIVRSRSGRAREYTRSLLRINLICLEPLIILWSIWGMTLDASLALLPLCGLVLVVVGFFAGMAGSSLLHLSGHRRPTFNISSSIANHGFTMGGFLCYLFLGEEGLGLAFIFLAYFMIYIFTVIFPYARLQSTGERYSLSFLRDFLRNPQTLPLYAVLVALVLDGLHVPRPAVFFPFDLLLLVAVGIYYFAVGVNFVPGRLGNMRRENAMMAGIKFGVMPLVALGLVWLLPLSPSGRWVVLLESCMPAATYSVVAAVLYDLDADLASNLFVVNTGIFLVLVLPVILLLHKCGMFA